MRVRKLPVVVEAHQWFKNGDHPKDAYDGVCEGKLVRFYRRPDVLGMLECGECGSKFHGHGWIDTREGGHTVCPGDWIITGVEGEHYPCKPSVFAKTYEIVEK